mgnify:CR=1 FL=1
MKLRLISGLALVLMLSTLVFAAHLEAEDCNFWCKVSKFLAQEGRSVVGEAVSA